MKLTVNGEPFDAPAGATVQTLLDLKGLANRPCAVEINKQLAPKSEHDSRALAENDAVEIVTLVGGG